MQYNIIIFKTILQQVANNGVLGHIVRQEMVRCCILLGPKYDQRQEDSCLDIFQSCKTCTKRELHDVKHE